MKFNCGKTPEEKKEDLRADLQIQADHLKVWHDWFAWFPVRMGSRDCRWLETVERRVPNAYVYEDCFGELCGAGTYKIEYRPKS